MDTLRLSGPADNALAKLQETNLDPMQEALFQAWAKANQIKKTDVPGNVVDYRGIYQNSGGEILPNGELKRITDKINDQHKLEQVLRDRVEDRIAQSKQKMLGELDASTQARTSAASKAAKGSPSGDLGPWN